MLTDVGVDDGTLTEIDAGYTYNVSKNASISLVAGYLIPGGDAFDNADNASTAMLSADYKF